MDIIYALNALGGLLAFLVGVAIGSLIAAIWLRLAARWLGFGDLAYATAFKVALTSNFVVVGISLSIGVDHGIAIAMLGESFTKQRSGALGYSFASSPTYFLLFTALVLVVKAVIFRRMIPSSEEASPISFSDSLSLASLYIALAITCGALIVLLLSCILFGFLHLIGA